jgi:hypothetical protein
MLPPENANTKCQARSGRVDYRSIHGLFWLHPQLLDSAKRRQGDFVAAILLQRRPRLFPRRGWVSVGPRRCSGVFPDPELALKATPECANRR